MPKFKVEIIVTDIFIIEVEADDAESAYEAAGECYTQSNDPEKEFEFSTDWESGAVTELTAHGFPVDPD